MAQAPLSMDDWRVKRFMEWLCTPPKAREPRTQLALSEELGMSGPQVLTNWKSHVTQTGVWHSRHRNAALTFGWLTHFWPAGIV